MARKKLNLDKDELNLDDKDVSGSLKSAPTEKGKVRKRKTQLACLTSDILHIKSHVPPVNSQSITEFLRSRKYLKQARDVLKQKARAKKLGISVEACPLPDPIFNRYQEVSFNRNICEDFDIISCKNDKILFEFATEIAEQASAAEIGPDDGIPIGDGIILPRSFLLDQIHRAASKHCLFLHSQNGKEINREACPSPIGRSKNIITNDQYKFSAKCILKRTEKYFENENKKKNSGGVVVVDKNEHGDDPDFDAILNYVLETDEELEPLDYSFDDDTNTFGADALWSLDTSSLLAFGVLAEEFIISEIESAILKAQSN